MAERPGGSGEEEAVSALRVVLVEPADEAGSRLDVLSATHPGVEVAGRADTALEATFRTDDEGGEEASSPMALETGLVEAEQREETEGGSDHAPPAPAFSHREKRRRRWFRKRARGEPATTPPPPAPPVPIEEHE